MDLGGAAQQWQAHGFVILPGFVPAAELEPALEDTVEHAAQQVYARGLKRLPVVDAAGHVVGIISRTDVLAVFDRTDEDIRVEITRQVIPVCRSRASTGSW